MGQQVVAKDCVVSVTYTIRDENDEVIEAVEVPVDYIQGSGKLFEKLEAILEGKTVGDVLEVTLSPAEGFGEYDPNKTFTDNIENVPPEFRQIGAEAQFYNDAGDTITMTVTHVDRGTVTLNGNHPFAGKTVTFGVKINAIREATAQELATGEIISSPVGGLH